MRNITHPLTVCVVGLILACGAAIAAKPLEPGPPEVPGPCPCFTQAEVDAFEAPYDQCTLDHEYDPDHPWENLDSRIVKVDDPSADPLIATHLAMTTYSEKPDEGFCWFFSEDTMISRTVDHISYREFLACRSIIAEKIYDDPLQCVLLCDPECPEE